LGIIKNDKQIEIHLRKTDATGNKIISFLGTYRRDCISGDHNMLLHGLAEPIPR